MQRWSSIILTAGFISSACATESREESSFGDASGPTSGQATTAGDASGSAADTSDEGTKLDVGAATAATAEGGDSLGCEKADFLFIIDNSGSMQDEQANLIASFPGFISTIQSTLMAQDYHIMVIDTDASGGGGYSSMCVNGVCTCEPVPACCDQVCATSDTCNGIPCDELPGSECDGTLGAGKIFRSDGTQCLSEMGPRYMTDSDAALGDTFSCAAEVGTFGDGNEQPMAGMVAALTDPLATAGGCNEGFLRDDAILVVTFITDEADVDKSAGDPASWKQALVDAKKGNEEAIVVLGLFGDTDQPNPVCQPLMDINGAEAAPRLRTFVESFGDHGVWGSVCSPDYTPFFLDAVGLIDLTCDEFDPVG